MEAFALNVNKQRSLELDRLLAVEGQYLVVVVPRRRRRTGYPNTHFN